MAVNKPGAKEAGSKESEIMSQRQNYGPHMHWVLYAISRPRERDVNTLIAVK